MSRASGHSQPPALADERERERAATDLGTSLVVTAGAGTGKTSLMVERVLHAVLAGGVPLTRLAIITFTDKAAAELRERIEDALETVIELGATTSNPRGSTTEAHRALGRLGPAERDACIPRAQSAIAALDDAVIATIHAFAGDILRRNSRAVDIDAGFQIDADGLAFDELFGERWAEFLQETLGGPDGSDGSDGSDETVDRTGWRQLLDTVSIDDVERVARLLCGVGIPSSTLEPEGVVHQSAFTRAIAQGLLRDLDGIDSAIADADPLKSFTTLASTARRVLETVTATGELPAADSFDDCAKGPSPGKKSGVADPAGLGRDLKRIRDRTLKLARCDPQLVSRLGGVLVTFAGDFRLAFRRQGYVSFDSLLRLARDLLVHDAEVRRREAARLDQILIDEFQDTDPLQYDIAFALAAPPAGSFGDDPQPGKLFIVGDGKQSIYAFRGADIGTYRTAVERLRSSGEEVTLRANFRSRPELVEPLNGLFASTFDPERSGGRDPRPDALVAQKEPAGESRIEVWSVGSPGARAPDRRSAEAAAIATWIDDHVHDGSSVSYRDVAVLFRALTNVDLYLRELRQRGVPYVVEGGRDFFARYEVELLLALLRTVIRPADPVALISCLRSPLGAVPDPELQRWADERRGAGAEAETRDEPLWHLDAHPDPDRFPALARALATLRAFAESQGDLGVDRIALAALDELPLRLAVAASYDGAQRVANLEKAVRHIVDLARSGRWRDEQILDRIEAVEAHTSAEGDSPLADESVDAVRILSIHKSKGLEWPVVIIPDLAREARSRPSGLEAKPVRLETVEALALRIGALETPAHVYLDAEKQLADEAEGRRLLYVATTRARERLILVVGGESTRKGNAPWVDALAYWGYERGREFARPDGERASLTDGVDHARIAEPRRDKATPRGEVSADELIAAAERFERATSAPPGDGELPLLAPSGQDEGPAETVPSEAPPRGPARARDVARATGSAVHLLLEAWPSEGGSRAQPQWLRDNAARAVRVACGEEPTADEAAVLTSVLAVLDRAEASGELARLAELDVLGREVPLLARGEGELWDGAIDLIARTAAGHPAVFDYKTDEGTTAEELAARHRAQLDVYSSGVAKALGISADGLADIVALPPEDSSDE